MNLATQRAILFRNGVPVGATTVSTGRPGYATPTGVFAIDVKLFANGAPIAQTSTALEVIKAGFEQYVADAAVNHGLLYGLLTTLMALLTGWFASVVFRRD